MTKSEWYTLLDMPDDVTKMLEKIGEKAPYVMPEDLKKTYLCRETTEEAFEQLKAAIGEDPDGMKQLYAVMDVTGDAWQRYLEKGISAGIFAETMKLVPRFLRSFHDRSGEWKFNTGWWFWRELALLEFRAGCLEYELVAEKGRRFISLHIPSDADLSAEAIDASFAAFKRFLAAFYPEWQNLPWECDSWMMSPALEHLLPETSKILQFNRRFRVLEENAESLGVLNWVFPGCSEISADLPENTSLQRSMKSWLLSGNTVAWTRAVLRE